MSRQVIGMMEGAFFVPQGELISWLNSFYGFELTKVEEACTGSVYCQVIDSIHPGQVPLNKVNFDARFDYEWVANYKVLQTSFEKLGIQKSIDVQSLIKGKRMDNLEFLQWLKRYFDLNYNGEPYNAVAIREEARTAYYKNKGNRPPKKSKSTASSSTTNPSSASSTKSGGTATTAPAAGTSNLKSQKRSSAKKSSNERVAVTKAPSPARDDAVDAAENKENSAPKSNPDKTLKAEIGSLKSELSQVNETLASMEKERDYYYAKLRKIELLCQQSEMTSFVQQVQDIMYADE